MQALIKDFIPFCFVVFVVYWIVTAFSVKRTAGRQGWWSRWESRVTVIAVAMSVASFLLFPNAKANPLDSGAVLWPRILAVRIFADAVTFCGLAVTLWARTVLGGNWSGVPVIKEGHELIDRGPYAHVRHPIYSGILLMFLGLAIFLGTVNAFAVLILFFVVFHFKARKEETLLTAHFPDAYPQYKARTKALIPGVF